MPQLNRRELDERSRQYGFNRDTFEKVLRLKIILEYFNSQDYLKEHLLAKDFFVITENISYQVAAGNISKELLSHIMTAIMDNTYDQDEELKLEIYAAISKES